jgi:outer membrane protein assembly factor BamB
MFWRKDDVESLQNHHLERLDIMFATFAPLARFSFVRFRLTLAVVRSFAVGSLASVAIVLSSCGNQQEAFQGFTLYGGKSRANNFELSGTFSASLTFQEKAFVSKDKKSVKLVGAAAQLIPVSFATAFIPTSDGHVVRVSNRLLEWRSPLDDKAIIASSSVADRTDNFYGIASDGAMYSFTADGKRRWKLPLFAANAVYTDALMLADGVVVGCEAVNGGGNAKDSSSPPNRIVKVSTDGAILWKQDFTLAPTRACAADDQENILVALTANRTVQTESNRTNQATDALMLLAPNGKRLWSLSTPNVRLTRMPVIAGKTAYIGGWQQAQKVSSASGGRGSGVDFVSAAERVPVLLAVDIARGKLLWTKPLLVPATGIAANGEMVVIAGVQLGMGEPYSAVVAYSPQGKELWRKGFALQIASVPMISKENIAFVGSKGEAVGIYYLKKDGTFGSVFSISDMPPMFLQPAVDYDGNMVFATTEDLGVVKVGRSPAQKLLPY